LRLKSGQSLDFEAAPSVNLTITARDAGGLELAKPFTLAVTDANEPPTNVTLAGSTIAENAAGAVLGAVSVADPDAGDSHSLLISDNRFEVAAGQLQLKAGQSLDYESEPSVSLTITARDAGGLELVRPVTITVANVNEPPSNLLLPVSSVAENATGAVISNVNVSDPDVGDSHVFLVSDSRFDVVAGKLRLKTDQGLDYEVEPSVNLTITARDAGGLETTTQFLLTVANINEPTTSIVLTGDSLAEETPSAVVGSVVVADPDVGDSLLVLVSDGRFEIAGGQLRLRGGVVDFESEPSIDVTITARDQRGLELVKSFTLTVTNVNEAPTGISLAAGLVPENAAGAVIGTITVADADPGDSHSLTLSLGDDRFEIVGSQLRLKAGGSLDFEAESRVVVRVTARDAGGLELAKLLEFFVQNVNEAPTSISVTASSVAENELGAIVGLATVADPDAGDLHSLVVSDSRFEIVSGQFHLKIGQRLDFETEPSVPLTITARDAGGLETSRFFTIVVTDANDPPTSIGLTNQKVRERILGETVGLLSAADQDVGQSRTFAVDDGRFEVVGAVLKLRDERFLDQSLGQSVTITVTATDDGVPPALGIQTFTLEVTATLSPGRTHSSRSTPTTTFPTTPSCRWTP